MKKTVNFCGNCPFFVTSYDDFAIGESFTYSCNLSEFKKNEEYFLDSNHDTPDWCPLKEEEVTFNFREFSPERLEEINKIDAQIIEIDKYFGIHDWEDHHEDEEFIKNSDKLRDLYNRLSELQDNEEIPYYQEFQEDLKKALDGIKEQLSVLEQGGINLKDAFSNLGKL